MTKEQVLKLVESVPIWGQSIPLPYGVVTPGQTMSNLELIKKLPLQEDMTGMRVLDLGAWDGYYSFECERRGAEVVAIDNLERLRRPDELQHGPATNRGFEVAKSILGSKVQFVNMDINLLDTNQLGHFDIVLCLGVLYHLRDFMLALHKIALMTDRLIIETEYFRDDVPLIQYAHNYRKDPTNWFIPSDTALRLMLRDSGFTHARMKPWYTGGLAQRYAQHLRGRGRMIVDASW